MQEDDLLDDMLALLFELHKVYHRKNRSASTNKLTLRRVPNQTLEHFEHYVVVHSHNKTLESTCMMHR